MPDLLWFRWRRSKDGYSIRKNTPTAYERQQHRETINIWKKRYLEGRSEEMIEADKVRFGRDLSIEDYLNKNFEYRNLSLYPNSQDMEEYEPLKNCSGLYKEFENLKDSPEEYLRFANDYGLLRSPRPHQINPSPQSLHENLSDWLNERNRMRRVIEAWEKCNNNESLEAFIERYSGRFGGVSLILRKSFDTTRPSLYLSPTDLRHAIELQFFQAISSNLQVQRCAVCPKWFTFGAGTGRRKSAHYCSDRCRKAAFLERKKSKK
jgi:hypothetical protein